MIQLLGDAFFFKLTKFSFLEIPTNHAIVVGFYLEHIIQNAIKRYYKVKPISVFINRLFQ